MEKDDGTPKGEKAERLTMEEKLYSTGKAAKILHAQLRIIAMLLTALTAAKLGKTNKIRE